MKKLWGFKVYWQGLFIFDDGLVVGVGLLLFGELYVRIVYNGLQLGDICVCVVLIGGDGCSRVCFFFWLQMVEFVLFVRSLMMNVVVLVVGLMFVFSFCCVYVVLVLIIGVVVGGLFGGLGFEGIFKVFNGGFGGGVMVVLLYVMFGVFVVVIVCFGVVYVLVDKVLVLFGWYDEQGKGVGVFKWILVGLLFCVVVFLQNILLIYIVFILLLVLLLFYVLSKLQIDW